MGRFKITAKKEISELPVWGHWKARLIRDGLLQQEGHWTAPSADYWQFMNCLRLKEPLLPGESMYVICETEVDVPSLSR